MNKRRGILTFLMILVLGVAAGLSATHAWRLRLPDPDRCDREQLLQWLVAREIGHEPRQIQEALVGRLEEEILVGIEAGQAAAALSDQRRERLQENVELLKHVWFVSRVKTLFALPLPQRSAHLDRQVAVIHAWASLDMELSGAGGGTASQEASEYVPRFFDQIQSWIDTADGPEQQQMSHAVEMGVIRWLATRDLAAEPMSTRRELARRIARRLDRGFDLANGLTIVPGEAQREQLRANGRLLMEAWLYDRAEEYVDIEADAQPAFIDRQIDAVMHWGVIELLVPRRSESADSPGANSLTLIAQFAQTVDSWVGRAPRRRRDSLQELVQAFKQQMVLRALGGTLLPPDRATQ